MNVQGQSMCRRRLARALNFAKSSTPACRSSRAVPTAQVLAILDAAGPDTMITRIMLDNMTRKHPEAPCEPPFCFVFKKSTLPAKRLSTSKPACTPFAGGPD